MKVDSSGKPAPARPVAKAPAAARAEAAKAAPAASAIDATRDVLGIPAEELSPKVREVLLTLMAEVEALRKELDVSQRRIAELEKLADTDALSPVANRRAFVRELSRTMSYSERYAVPTSLLFFDVNGLKAINDELGHKAGDAVLRHVADTLRANIRASDIVGRLGGDEYAVVLTHADEANARLKATPLSQQISATPIDHDGQTIHVSAAVGCYTFGPGENPTDVIANADKRMYEDKRRQKAARENAKG